MFLVHDPQTSGGLLIAVSPESAELVELILRKAAPQLTRLGIVRSRTPGVDVLIRH